MTDATPREDPATASSASSPRLTVNPSAILAILLVMAAVLAINNRILTYVSGQDPMTYVRAAHDLLRGGWSAILHSAGGFTAPGFALLLAGAISLFGPFAPYWVNPVLALLMAPLGVLLLTRMGLAPRHAGIALLAAVFVLVAGCPQNAPFLLYPFRELPSLFFTLAGIWLFLASCDVEDRPWLRATLAGAAGVCALVTAGIREPSILGFSGVLVWCSASRMPWRAKSATLGSFAAPIMLAAIAWLVMTHGAAPSAQWSYWTGQIAASGIHAMLKRFAGIEPQMRAWIFEELGWFWTATCAAGIWGLRRNPRALFTLLVPAVMLYAFYGFMEAHRRYLLGCLVFCAPLAGCGLAWLIETAAARLPTSRAALRAAPATATLLALACALVPVVVALGPMGPRVKAPQVERFLDTTSQIMPADDRILLTPYSRYAADAMLSFTSLRPGDVLSVKRRSLLGEPLLLLGTLNEQARFRGKYTPYAGPDAPAIVRHFADVFPVLGKDGQPAVFTLGHGQYEILRSQPWHATESHHVIRLAPAGAHLIWLDLRAADPSIAKTVSVVNPANGSDSFVTTLTGSGLQPILVPTGVSAGMVPLRIRASGPIPCDVPITIQTGDRPANFPLDDRRSFSVHSWFQKPFKQTSFGDKYAAMFDNGGGRIVIPMPAAASDLRVAVAVLVNAPANVAQPAVFQFLHDGQVAGEMRLAPDSKHWHGFQLDHTKAGQPLRIDLRSTTPDNKTTWRIHRILITIQPATAP